MAAETIPLDRDSYWERQRYLARALVVALSAEDRSFDHEVRQQGMGALGLTDDDYNIEHWKLIEEKRVEYSVDGLKPVAGTFPETEFEHRVRTMVVVPLAEKFDEAREIKLGAGRELQQQAIADVSRVVPTELESA